MAGKSWLDILDGNAPRVLFCDDGGSSGAFVKQVLEPAKVRVDLTYSVEEAVEQARRHPCDVVVVDCGIDGDAGLECARELRSEQSDKIFLPVILLCDIADPAWHHEALEAGATDFLAKPLDPAELKARVLNLIAAKRLHDRSLRIAKELEEERNKVFAVQRSLLPRSLPTIPGVNVQAGHLQCRTASGDLYALTARPNGSVLFALGDASGHGMMSAMNMSTVRSVLLADAMEPDPVEVILRHLNRVMMHELDGFSFVTLYLAEYSPATRRLRHVSAGHPPPMLYLPATGEVRNTGLQTSLPLGVVDDLQAKPQEIDLPYAARLVAFSDGIYKQTSPAGAAFGEADLARALAATGSMPLKQAGKSLLDTVSQFAGPDRIDDDVTFVMIEAK